MALEDDAEIRNLLARDMHITDGYGSMEEYLTLWTADSTWSSAVAGSFRGHEGHLARHERYRGIGLQGPGTSSYHLLTTVWVNVTGEDAAEALSTWMLIVRTPGGPKLQDLGNFEDTLRREDGAWKLASRVVSQGDGGWLKDLMN